MSTRHRTRSLCRWTSLHSQARTTSIRSLGPSTTVITRARWTRSHQTRAQAVTIAPKWYRSRRTTSATASSSSWTTWHRMSRVPTSILSSPALVPSTAHASFLTGRPACHAVTASSTSVTRRARSKQWTWWTATSFTASGWRSATQPTRWTSSPARRLSSRITTTGRWSKWVRNDENGREKQRNWTASHCTRMHVFLFVSWRLQSLLSALCSTQQRAVVNYHVNVFSVCWRCFCCRVGGKRKTNKNRGELRALQAEIDRIALIFLLLCPFLCTCFSLFSSFVYCFFFFRNIFVSHGPLRLFCLFVLFSFFFIPTFPLLIYVIPFFGAFWELFFFLFPQVFLFLFSLFLFSTSFFFLRAVFFLGRLVTPLCRRCHIRTFLRTLYIVFFSFFMGRKKDLSSSFWTVFICCLVFLLTFVPPSTSFVLFFPCCFDLLSVLYVTLLEKSLRMEELLNFWPQKCIFAIVFCVYVFVSFFFPPLPLFFFFDYFSFPTGSCFPVLFYPTLKKKKSFKVTKSLAFPLSFFCFCFPTVLFSPCFMTGSSGEQSCSSAFFLSTTILQKQTEIAYEEAQKAHLCLFY